MSAIEHDPMTGMSSMLCGRCYHPMHWHKCGAGADLTGGPCPCRNDGPDCVQPHDKSEPEDRIAPDGWRDARSAPVPLRGKRKSCRHPGTWSWFTPLLRGHTRVWCVGCAKWADEIRAAKPRAEAMALQRHLDGAS